MFIWKSITRTILPWIGLALLAAACTGAGETTPVPAAEPATAIPTEGAAEIDPRPTAVPEDEVSDEVSEDEVSEDEASGVEGTEIEDIEEAGTPPTRLPADKYADLEIVTLLPRDGIPAIDNPRFLPVTDADDYYDPDELVIGVDFNGEARAYSVPYLSNHEIVNDNVGGVKISVTW